MNRPAPPRLIVITDWSQGPHWLFERLKTLAPLGGEIGIQHRHPGASGFVFWQEAKALASFCGTFKIPFFINSRLDVAIRLKAHFHLSSQSMEVHQARSVLAADRWVSAAAHSLAEMERRKEADFVLVSPVFPGGSKQQASGPYLGVKGFQDLAERSPIPAYALGGISPENAGVLQAHGWACIHSVLNASSPLDAAKQLLGC